MARRCWAGSAGARSISEHFGGKFPRGLKAAMDSGLIARQPIEPLARLLLGAVTEAAVAFAPPRYQEDRRGVCAGVPQSAGCARVK